ncbi:MAG TPA: polyprenol monophosphomannose synthase [Saprospiraceae bacterium]|nr:polyprenol monophosphomannose synthase [Saprospiraceae bacterium]HOJ90618.1 polyprenol monophosphomannose synthase [Saprospiraceae bacterium]HUN16233.1 polyprenol monophosphomannose synthase [Saprospiraceae bacterium]
MSKKIVIIPTYNEIENIEAIINAVLEQPSKFDILIVDDGSPDGTGNEVKRLQKINEGRLHLLERSGKSGLGTAYIAGFKWCLGNNYDFILEMDADFSHPPIKLNELLEKCETGESDVSVGSRYIDGGGVVNWPTSRLALSKGASLYVRLFTGMDVKDPTAGFVCYSRKVLEAINLDQIKFVGYAFQIEMKYASYRLGFKIKEVPIIFQDRQKGKSKMNIFIIREALTGVFAMRFLHSYKRYVKN